MINRRLNNIENQITVVKEIISYSATRDNENIFINQKMNLPETPNFETGARFMFNESA